ncbi:3-oxoacyl-ACP synthase [Streptomyces sp. NRRL B-1568]|uniref:3-oxoacyl-[acyl-carrier-protein] synthase-3 n=1 Tax=Streptomyces olivoverticillatus TaxID=66427 RepID=A0A7W7LPS7_9ACTN|nr:3-oxoacyl-ACP synthase [Streptomyces olivoverticillatus]KJY42532.1 3-oxoacyl-ACP synthase [Streptomyces sp. NRRL B-1568]MBB4894203.1 3-oxoacyl-[acyl-carrier-protein] synthase-3 [Streptomyces olivoverticillatus]
MSDSRVWLSGAQYVLGEIEAPHTDIENLADRAREFGMPPQAKLWGWGNIRRTGRTLEELAVESGRAVLAAAGIAAESVDGFVLCSTRFPGGPRTHGAFVAAIMEGIGLGDAAFTGVTLNRCTNLLAGVRLAQALVAAGHHRRVLVVTTDRIDDESERMENFALFSDGAAGCVVADAPLGADSYAIEGSATAQRPGSLDWSNEISPELSRQVNERLLGPLEMKTGDLDGVLHPNLYRPVVVLKERQAGFSQEQLYTDNITRFGHCFAADPLINLVDRNTAGQLRDGGHYMLVSSVPGARVGVLLRKLPGADR